jgi:hypothetical protein
MNLDLRYLRADATVDATEERSIRKAFGLMQYDRSRQPCKFERSAMQWKAQSQRAHAILFLFSLISYGVIEQVAIACESPSLGYQGDQAEMIR